MGYRFLILVVILLANGFFAAAEVALVSVRKSRLRALAEQGNAAAHIALNLLANPGRLLSVTQVGVTLASLGLGWAGEGTVFNLFVNLLGTHVPKQWVAILHGVSFAAAFLIISYLHVVIGEVARQSGPSRDHRRAGAPALLTSRCALRLGRGTQHRDHLPRARPAGRARRRRPFA